MFFLQNIYTRAICKQLNTLDHHISKHCTPDIIDYQRCYGTLSGHMTTDIVLTLKIVFSKSTYILITIE